MRLFIFHTRSLVACFFSSPLCAFYRGLPVCILGVPISILTPISINSTAVVNLKSTFWARQKRRKTKGAT
ncbi:hypothetical protein HDV64DRAFT_246477 [Trichoderma sp. TUCIM 5745]